MNTVAEKIPSVANLFEQAGLYFGHGTDNAFDEAAYIIAFTLSCPLEYDDAFYETQLTADQDKKINQLVQQRISSRKPVAYLTNEAYFAGQKFFVNEHVLVPRSPIAELILDDFVPWIERDNIHAVLDLCTGSGCIGIACAMQFEHVHVTLSDIDVKALEVAQINTRNFHLQDRVKIVQSDLFDAIPPQKYDIIVSNPPYVDAEDMAALPEEYRQEPALGLAAGDDGLLFVDRILRQSHEFLSPHGILIVEVGNSAEALISKYPNVPFVWLDFAYGGEGVFLIEANALARHLQQ